MNRVLVLLISVVSLLLLQAPVAWAAGPAAGPPLVQTNPCSATTATSTTLNATVNPNGAATTYHFEYGTTTAYGSATPNATTGSGNANQQVTADVTGLSPNTTYHYRIVATNSSGTTTGSDATCTTASSSPGTPVATTGGASAITNTTATVNGTVNPNGQSTTYYFQYGTTTAYGAKTTTAGPISGSTSQSVSANLSGLVPGATYHYRLVAVNASGTANGADATFKTTGSAPPSASRLALFGHTAFVSPSHVFGVFVGCFGARSCSGNMTVTAGGRVIGSRSLYFVGANDGGIVHLTLNSRGRTLLARAPGHHLLSNVTVNGIKGTVGHTSRTVTIVPFS